MSRISQQQLESYLWGAATVEQMILETVAPGLKSSTLMHIANI